MDILERLDFQNNMEPTRPIYRDAKAEIEKLRAAASLAREALDGLMGDSDLPDDDSDEMKAMQALNAVLPEPA